MLEIQTSALKSRKHVLIDNHPYIIRRLGAGEELRLSQMMRRIQALANKEKGGSLSEEENQEADKISAEMLAITAACFEDGEGGEKAEALIKQLSTDELKEIYNQVFKENEPAKETTA